MVSYADVRDARVAPLRYAAQAWTELARACADLEQRCGADLTGPLRASGWAGPAANAALDRLDVLDDEFEVASLQTRTAASVLRSAAEDFEDVQRRLAAAVHAARSVGLTVDDNGRVSPHPIPSAVRNDPDAALLYERDRQNAAIYTDLIARIVADATEADNRVARALAELKAGVPGQRPWEYNKAQDGARAAAAALGLSEGDIPAQGSSPTDVRAWWSQLSDDERQVYLTAYPQRIGALDGLPAVDRDAANQLVLRTYIGDNVNLYRDERNPQHATALMLLDKLEAAENAPPHKRLYLLSVDPRGDGKAAVAIGNPDTADHTAVLVPGVGTELAGIRGLIGRANDLQDAAIDLAPTGSEVAVVAWLGYDTPSVDTDIVTAPFGGKSEAGARALDGFVDGLRAAHDGGTSHLTVVAHSYGSTVLGEAASSGDGLAVDDMIAVGSPGMRVDHAQELGVDPRHVWAAAAADDTFVARPEENARWLTGIPVVGSWAAAGAVGIHGPGPHLPEFGGNALQVDTSGHSGYWTRGSQTLLSQGAIIAGNYEAAVLDHGQRP
ncbi:PPE domain-containing protein [Micromonospora zingiberis]|uniref:PPE domain-containing protein n=1 Tax=Micromonospora zingiberis TaxID=2053011 RepID=A0A4R0G0U6_9ACTN|nr:alpha/beta hydrolase [Micromonospora zingiberis]TCB89402.1 PPE domain-containing protein [Micromonospora zingiberis]